MEIADKDVYEYISNFADDKTLINMILANSKVFDNEKFYEKVIRKRYPLLMEYLYNKTWKFLYLDMVRMLSKVEEEYQIPYIPTKGYSPGMILVSRKKDVYDTALYCAAAGGNIDLIDYFIKKGATKLDDALINGCKYADLRTVEHLIDKGAEDYHTLIYTAASLEKIDIMQFLLDYLEIHDLNSFGRRALYEAISHGHINAVKFLVENGMRILESNIENAEDHGKYDIAEYLRKFV